MRGIGGGNMRGGTERGKRYNLISIKNIYNLKILHCIYICDAFILVLFSFYLFFLS